MNIQESPNPENRKVVVFDNNGKQMISSVVSNRYLNEFSGNWWKTYLPKGMYKAFVFDTHQNKTSLNITID